MLELRQGDLFRQPRSADQVLIVTTNGDVRRDGQCVMGRGIARQVRDNVVGSAARLGALIQEFGNRPFRISEGIWSLPVKHHWPEKADLALIEDSLWLMQDMVRRFTPHTLMFPRPGCGNGGLDWSDVAPLMTNFDLAVPSITEIWDFTERGQR